MLLQRLLDSDDRAVDTGAVTTRFGEQYPFRRVGITCHGPDDSDVQRDSRGHAPQNTVLDFPALRSGWFSGPEARAVKGK